MDAGQRPILIGLVDLKASSLRLAQLT